MTTDIRDSQRHFYTADDLFELVADVSRYPDFIHQITALRIQSDDSTETLRDFVAQVRVRYKMVSEKFSTRVTADPAARKIVVSFVAGPFRQLDNHWHFYPLSDGSTLVNFNLVAQLKNPILQVMLDSNRERAVRVLTGKFMGEAARRYDTSGNPSVDLAEEINALGK